MRKLLMIVLLFAFAHTIYGQEKVQDRFGFSTAANLMEFTADGDLKTSIPLGVGFSYKPKEFSDLFETGLYFFPDVAVGGEDKSALALGTVTLFFGKFGAGWKWRAWKEGIGFADYSMDDLSFILSYDFK